MSPDVETCLRIVAIGAGATAVTDLWALLRRQLFGTPLPNFGFVGRWILWIARGRLRHDRIAASPQFAGELVTGWASHYLIGIAFAALLVLVAGPGWIRSPTPGPALAVGIATVVFPLFVMQPGMGAGIAASRTPNPAAARIQSLVTHAVFGLGLYATALTLDVLDA